MGKRGWNKGHREDVQTLQTLLKRDDLEQYVRTKAEEVITDLQKKKGSSGFSVGETSFYDPVKNDSGISGEQ